MHSQYAGMRPARPVRRAVRAAAWAGAGCLALFLAACGSQPRGEGNYLLDDIDAQRTLPDAGWEALKAELPPVPTEADVLPVEGLSRNERFRFGVDPRSIQIAPGLIVRYTLRAVSDMGAENISYESVRCGTREWRTVALYRPGAGWQRPVHDEWRPLLPNTIQHLLRNGVLCSGGGPAGAKASDLVYRVRHWDRYADAMAGRNTQ
ncbi:CNP1-like family protein [Pigmentiphaga sp.]|uniref:CNP1-like family protein n=1 Tax=Pigmentiphaga sp. TaxID=1977564 RepID=UPI0025E9A8F5|nr:CNP1-like family protein [Pigmentiphaga sp.]